MRPNQHLNEPWSATGKRNPSFGSNYGEQPGCEGRGERVAHPVARPDVAAAMGTHQAYRDLTWTMGLSDSTGAPLVGLHLVVYLDQLYQPDTGNIVYKAYSAATGSSRRSGTINVGTCFGDFQTTFVDYAQGYKNTWRTDQLRRGGMEVLEYPGIGVGGDNTEFVSFGHLCKQTC